MACLFNYLPGYLAPPNHNVTDLDAWTSSTGTFRRTFLVNLLKAWFGNHATPENDFCFNWLPKKNGKANYSLFRIFETAIEGKMKLLYVMGQNPMVTNPNLSVVHEGLSKLDMLVGRSIYDRNGSLWEKPRSGSQEDRHRGYLSPAASFLEKDGTLTNSGRMVQWRYTGIEPPGQAKDLEIIDLVFKKVRERTRVYGRERYAHLKGQLGL